MIEIKEALIYGKKTSEKEISLVFDKGQINSLEPEDLYIFNFLSLKNQALEKGSFIIDGITIYPAENDDDSIAFLTINSLIKLNLCFVIKKQDKKQLLTKIQQELSALKDLPINTEEEKEAKIAAIFSIIEQNSPNYIQIDKNELVNRDNNYLDQQLEAISKKITTILLTYVPPIEKVEEPVVEETIDQEENIETIDSEPEIVEEKTFTVEIGKEPELASEEPKPKKQRKVKVKKEKSTNKNDNDFFKALGKTIKENIMVFLSFLIPAIGVVAFTLLSPLYAKTEQKVLLIPFIITIIICFILYVIMTYKCCENESENKKQDKVIFFIVNSVVTLLGSALGVLIYILFVIFDKSLVDSGFNQLGIILASVLFIVLITLNLYIYKVINLIKKMFKRN